MKKHLINLFQKILRNNNNQPIKYWLYHQSPRFICNLMWKYDDFKYYWKCKLENYFTYYPQYVEGYIVAKDETGVWLGWSDEDTFIDSSNKKWIKLFDKFECGDTFKCKIKWDPLKDELYKIKNVQLIEHRRQFNEWCKKKEEI